MVDRYSEKRNGTASSRDGLETSFVQRTGLGVCTARPGRPVCNFDHVILGSWMKRASFN